MTIPNFPYYPLTNTGCNDAHKVNRNLGRVIDMLTDGTYHFTIGSMVSNGLVTALDFKIPVQSLGTPTYSTINDYCNSFGACGRKTGGTITDATGGYVAVSAGTGFIKATDDDNAQLMFFDWPAPANIQIPASSIRYIGVEYNSGVPQVVARTTDTWNIDSEFPLGRVVNENIDSVATLHILNNPWWVTDGITNIIERLKAGGDVIRDEHVGGLMLSVTGTRNISVTTGTLWSNLNEFIIPALDTSVSGTIEAYWYKAGDGWQQEDLTQYSVTEWNDVTLTALQTVSANKYCNVWVYVEADDTEISIVYPQAQYNTAAAAEAVTAPSNLPVHLATNGMLIGRIIFKQGVDAPVAVQTVFTNTFSASVTTDHGNLTGLADDDHTQYLLASGTRGLTGAWDAGSFQIRAETFYSDVAIGTKPFTIDSTTLCDNLNADLLDGNHAAAFSLASHNHGTGTTGILAKFTDGAAGTIGNSIITESGSDISVAGTITSSTAIQGTTGNGKIYVRGDSGTSNANSLILYDTGHMALGNDGDIGDKFFVNTDITNIGIVSFRNQVLLNITSNNGAGCQGQINDVRVNVTSTNYGTGESTSLYNVCARSSGSTNTGQYYRLNGAYYIIGHLDCNASAVTDVVAGIAINPYVQAGTISNLWCIFGGAQVGTGTITAGGYFIYDATGYKNYFNGSVGIGMSGPTYKLDVTGNIRCSTGFGCNGTTPQTAYASGGAVSTSAGAFGFGSDTERSNLTTLVSNIRAALVANGIMS